MELDLENLNLGLTTFHTNCTLDELSPIPISEIRLEILDRLGQQIGRSRHQADLCVKHILARLVFAATGNGHNAGPRNAAGDWAARKPV